MIVRSFGQLQALVNPISQWQINAGAVNVYSATMTYGMIYAQQPNVRTCCDFLSRNIAQLALHVYRRRSDTDRERLADHALVRWLDHPNPSTSRYRLFEDLVADLAVYFNAYWLKVRYTGSDGRPAIGLQRLPPAEMTVEGRLFPDQFCWTHDGQRQDFPPSEVIHFKGYNPLKDRNLIGLSLLETLRHILAEEAASSDHREQFWRNASRIDGVIERPVNAPRWQKPQKDEFREQWQSRFAGGAGAGMVAVLEDGMTFKGTSFSAKDSEYLGSRKLTREECAAAYHIPLPLVGILDHATFSNIKEQHKHLYQDTLGPWLEMIAEEIERQLLIECEDQTDVYTEFNIADKLKGSFEEQSTALQQLVGRPIMTANEGRARVNLPAITDDPSADELAAQQGGPATNAANPTGLPTGKEPLPPDDTAALAAIVETTRARQRSRLAKLPAPDRPAHFAADLDRWNRELAADLSAQTGRNENALAQSINAATLAQLEADALAARLRARRRTFERDPATGLVTAFTDTVEEHR